MAIQACYSANPAGNMTFRFDVSARDGAARQGRLQTAHGPIETPTFMPVGTAATVKAMTPEAVRETGAQIILGNTYHLMLRPNAERVAKLGRLNNFKTRQGPTLQIGRATQRARVRQSV